jgi:predicted TIM-barrel fold metal-dependent hydrolase
MAMILPSAVDVHAHFLPPSYQRALEAAGVDRPDGFPHVPDWSADSAVALMDDVGITSAVLSISSPGVHFLPVAARPPLARQVNEEGAQAVRDRSSRFGLLATLPLPDVDATLAEIEHGCDVLAVDGFVLMSNYDGIYLGDERFAMVMSELDRRGAVVALHPTSPPGSELTSLGRPRPMIEFIFDTTRAVVNLLLTGTLRRHPSIRVIVPHVGSALPTLADRVAGFTQAFRPAGGEHEDIFAALRSLFFDIAGAPFPNSLAALLRVAATDRILYGSDTPFTPQPIIERSARELLDSDLLDEPTRSAVLRANALTLFSRLEAQ